MSNATKRPAYGDFVFVPEPGSDEFWVRGVVNAINEAGDMLVTARAEVGVYAVGVNVDEYLERWAWPHDMPGLQASRN